MRLSTKASLSKSPGRTEKFPPPLLRFLKSNVGSKSRGKSSRKSPMFFRRKSTATMQIQEPSSPKVTCMGQVRVKRSTKQTSSSSKNNKKKTSESKVQNCKCIQNARFCCFCTCTCKVKIFRHFWRKMGSERKAQTKEDSSKCGIDQENDLQEEEESGESEDKSKLSASANSFSPPKNALLLMRSRSAPYRSSSLASQFWGSPLQKGSGQHEENTEIHNTEKVSNNSAQENEKKLEKLNIEESRTREDYALSSLRPLVLTRCKSEPARRRIITD